MKLEDWYTVEFTGYTVVWTYNIALFVAKPCFTVDRITQFTELGQTNGKKPSFCLIAEQSTSMVCLHMYAMTPSLYSSPRKEKTKSVTALWPSTILFIYG